VETNVVRLRVPAHTRYLALVGAGVRELCQTIASLAGPEASYRIELAVGEVCTNVIAHAYQGVPEAGIDLAFTVLPDQLHVEVRDRGVPFDPTNVPLPDLDQPREHGYGLYLLRSIMDELTYTREGDENVLHLVKNL